MIKMYAGLHDTIQRLVRGCGIIATMSCLCAANCSFAAETIDYTELEDNYPAYPQIQFPPGDQAKQIKLGEYLAQAGNCIACHTKDKGKAFAGGLPFKTPFGTIYSTNITPDKKTGIGKWTNQDFIRAMKHGVSPSGSYYFPVFPYPYFTKMSDSDVLAIKAYLNQIPAVEQVNIEPDMGIPFRWRFGQLAWRTLFYSEGEYQNDPNQSEEWNRGAYLVKGLGHCGMCHTPINFLGAPKHKYELTGAFVDGFYAPNISNTRLEAVTVKEIVNVFVEDHRIGGGTIAAKPMLEVNHNSMVHLTLADLNAIASYIKTVKSETPPVDSLPDETSPELGTKVYEKYCQACHETGSGGSPRFGDKAAWKPRIATGLNALYKNAILGMGSMPPKGNCIDCKDAEIQAAVDYIVDHAGGNVPETAAPSTQLTTIKPTLTLGKKVYTESCALCHDSGHIGAPKIGDKKAWQPLIKKNIDVLVRSAINGVNHPDRSAYPKCTDTDIIAAVKYMVQESRTSGDYSLW
ncbi:MAG: c-type cytochrome [Pseudomonadota bacterium]|nr:c-type cytochrome [Pseudomonadota bacterium]